MRLLKSKALLGLIVASLALVGCTRKTESDTSIHISFDGFGSTHSLTAQAPAPSPSPAPTPTVKVVILNIQGSGFQFFCQWNSHTDSSNSSGPLLPTPQNNAGCSNLLSTDTGLDLNLSVARGNSRLFQVLLVMGDNSGGTGDFYYADAKQDIAGDSMTVNLTVTSQGTSTSGQSNIAGRYLNAQGLGPTGTVKVFFQPNIHDGFLPPKMLVDQSNEIFGGWFRVFAVEGTQFQYVVSDGTDLFGGASAIDSTGIGTTSVSPAPTPTAQNLRVYVPKYFSAKNGGSAPYELQSHNLSSYGFFGPGAVGKKICYYGNSEPLTNLYIDSTGTGGNLVWNPEISNPGATDAFVVHVGGVAGGLSSVTRDANNLCTLSSLTRFSDYISLNDQQLNNNDSVLGFYGPFQMLPSSGGNGGGNAMSASYASGTESFAWKYLPGVQSTGTLSGVDGVDIFGRSETAATVSDDRDYRGGGDGVNCGGLKALNRPFRVLVSQPVNADGSLPSAASVALPSDIDATASSGLATFIGCPYSLAGGKHYFAAAAIARGGGGTQGPTVTVKMTAGGTDDFSTVFATSDNNQQMGSCKKWIMNVVDMAGNSKPAPGAISVSFGVNMQFGSQPLSFYSDSSCGTTISSLNIPASQSSAVFYGFASPSPDFAMVSLNTNGAMGGSAFIAIVQPSGSNATPYSWIPKPIYQNAMVVGQCYQIPLVLVDSTSTVPSYFTSAVADVTLDNSAAVGTFYNSPDCSANALTSGQQWTWPANTAYYVVSFKPTAPTGTGTSITATASEAGSVNPTTPILVDSPTASYFQPTLSGQHGMSYNNSAIWWAPAGCSQVGVAPESSHQAIIASPNTVASQDVSMSTSAGMFYTNATCTQGASSTATYHYGGSNSLFFKTAGTTTDLTSFGATTTFNVMPSNIYVQATTTQLCTSMPCSAGVLVSLRDENNNPYNAPASYPVTLAFDNGAFRISTNGPPASSCAGLSGAGSSAMANVAAGASWATVHVCSNSGSPTNSTLTANIPGANPVMLVFNGGVAPDGLSAMNNTQVLTAVPPVGGVLQVKSNQCEPLIGFPTTTSGHVVPNSTSGSGVISGTVYTPTNYAYGSASCTGNASSAPSFTGGTLDSPSILFLKVPAVTTYTYSTDQEININGTSSTGTISIQAQ